MQHQAHSETAERSRREGFLIALLVIGGSLLLIAVPTARDNVQGAKELAAIFSGWIAAIVGFYFMQGQAQQAAVAAEEAERERASAALRKVTLAMDALSAKNDELRKALQETLNNPQDYSREDEAP